MQALLSGGSRDGRVKDHRGRELMKNRGTRSQKGNESEEWKCDDRRSEEELELRGGTDQRSEKEEPERNIAARTPIPGINSLIRI